MKARKLKLHHRTKKSIEKQALKAFKNKDFRCKRRLDSILLSSEGYTSGEIAQKLKVSRQKVSLWLKTYEESGLEEIFSNKIPGRNCGLTESQKNTLCDIVDSGPVAYGLLTGVWTSPIIRDIIKDEFGLAYHEGHVRKLLKSLGFSVQRPKLLLARADKEKKRDWVQNRYPNIKKKPIKPHHL